MQPVSLNQLLAATGGTAVGFERHDVEFTGVSIDSRSIRPGELFWAVQGERHDGHAFLGEAFNRGAAACVIEHEKVTAAAGLVVVVEDTTAALGDLARWYCNKQEATIIGVTGSVGKTTTREMIHATLGDAFKGTQSPKNFNNHFGLPLSILEIEADHQFAVLELGASQAGEIRSLSATAAPQIGVITKIGTAHLQGFGSEEGILAAKGELLESLPKNGLAVLSGDDPRLRDMAQKAACRVMFVGEQPANDLQATQVETSYDCLRFRVGGDRIEVSAVGRHHLTAALAAVAIGRELGMTAAAIAEGLKSFQPVAGRCRVERMGSWTIIDDSYNSNPESMKAACDVLAGWSNASQKILVTGDMLELGERSAEFHRELGARVAGSGIDCLAAHGNWAFEVIRGACEGGMQVNQTVKTNNIESLTAELDGRLEADCVVLVKGSRAMRMERVVEWLRHRAEKEFTSNENTPGPLTRACV